jgi:hypothetical protein
VRSARRIHVDYRPHFLWHPFRGAQGISQVEMLAAAQRDQQNG